METETVFEVRERICKGCGSVAYDKGCIVCIKPINKLGEECPCSTCLIKMMCNHSCLEFRDYCNHM